MGTFWDVPASYAPERLYPRFAALASIASAIPRGLPLLMGLAGEAMGIEQNSSHVFSPGPAIAIVSFPRSGSLYVQAVVDTLIDGNRVSFRTHDALQIPDLAPESTPILVPLREATDTVVSWSIYNGDPVDPRYLSWRAMTLVAWLRKVTRYSRRFPLHVFDIKRFTEHPAHILEQVPGIVVSRSHDIDMATGLELLDELQHQADLPLEQRNFPASERTAMKRQYGPALQDPKVRRTLDQAENLRCSLLASYGVQNP